MWSRPAGPPCAVGSAAAPAHTALPCHGPRSTRFSWPRRVAFTAHVADVAGMDGVGELHVSKRAYVGLGPVGDGVTTVALVVPLAAVRRSRGEGRDFRRDFFAELER